MIGVSVPRECLPSRQRVEWLRARRAKNQAPGHMRCKRSGHLAGASHQMSKPVEGNGK